MPMAIRAERNLLGTAVSQPPAESLLVLGNPEVPRSEWSLRLAE